jgi:hypothetical protein
VGGPRVEIDERAITSFIDSGARRIAPKFQKRQQMRKKYFAPRGSITADRRWVNSLDHPELSRIGVFPEEFAVKKVNPMQIRGKNRQLQQGVAVKLVSTMGKKTKLTPLVNLHAITNLK